MYQSIALKQEKPFWLRDIVLVFAASILIALFGPLSFKLPFSPVPIATQPHVCLFLGAVLGKKRGALAVLLFLIQGACLGFPIFSCGSASIVGPTGGYLLGYVLGAYVTGLFAERMKLSSALVFGNGAIYLLGLPWLATYIGMGNAILLGFIPFILGDILKLSAIAKILK